jgi:hypothetical protein
MGVHVGISQFDLSGTGTAPFGSFRVEQEVNRFVVIEGALSYFRPEEQFGTRRHYFISEAQLQVQAPWSTFRPYLGVGGGAVIASGGRGTRETLAASGGVRTALSSVWDVRGELRVRNVGQFFSATTAEWTAGIARRF